MHKTELRYEYELFGKTIVIELYDIEDKIANNIMNDVHSEALRLQKIFNLYDPKSELSLINIKRELNASNEFLNVLKHALKFSKITNGAYDVTLGKNIMQRKYHKEITPINCSYKNVKIDNNKIIITNQDVVIDLGSIAKGAIADKIANFLKEYGVENAMIDARGDIIVFGDYEHDIEIQHPRNKDSRICKITLKNQAVATSGDYNQFDKNYDTSHILNQKDAISITVVAPTLEEADIYATVLFVCENNIREKIISENSNIKVLIINNTLDLKMYNGFENIVCKESNSI